MIREGITPESDKSGWIPGEGKPSRSLGKERRESFFRVRLLAMTEEEVFSLLRNKKKGPRISAKFARGRKSTR